MADLRVDGLDQMRMRLAGIPDKLIKSPLRSGLRQAANVVKAQAKANFDGAVGPNALTGDLKASIRVTQRRGTVNRVVFNVVAGSLSTAQKRKFGADSAFYALWVEKGHINRKAGQALRGSKESIRAVRAASGSNTPAHPYMRPAIEQKGQEALDTLVRVIGEKLPEIAS